MYFVVRVYMQEEPKDTCSSSSSLAAGVASSDLSECSVYTCINCLMFSILLIVLYTCTCSVQVSFLLQYLSTQTIIWLQSSTGLDVGVLGFSKVPGFS